MTLIVGRNLHLEGKVPEERDAVPLYRVTDVLSFSRGNETVRKMMDDRVEKWTGIFRVDAEPKDEGDMVVFLGEEAALEIYLPSDSVWWSDRKLAFAEEPPEEGLPDEGEAVERAHALISEMDAGHEGLQVAGTSTTNASMSREPKEETELVATGITVNFGYVLEDLPVLGPGAKVRVSFGSGGALAEFARFWRDAEEVNRVRPIHPYQAIERLASDHRFARIAEAGLEVVLDELRLGHYAAGPSHFQRYLVPVYEARGRVLGGELEDGDVFKLNISATDDDATTAKDRAQRDQAGFRRIFGGW